MDTIKRVTNTIIIDFEKKGKSFTTNVPHNNKWLSIIAFLRRRGFSVKQNEWYVKQYSSISMYHKLGIKKNVACLLEILPGSIKLQFGNTKNLWKDAPQSFWENRSDQRYNKLTYLESLAFELEIYKLLKFCERWGLEAATSKEETSNEDFIINRCKENPHIHGEVNYLDDIKLSITKDSYNYKCNSDDKNDKKIICGDKKYFYDYETRRLSCGIVWHNINNMWWVISGDKLRNIASFRLFDFDIKLARKEKVSQSFIDNLLKKLAEEKMYDKCSAIYKNSIGL